MLYTLNLYSVVYQLYFNERKIKEQREQYVQRET